MAMPESTSAVDRGPVEALRRELEAARALLQVQQDLEQALGAGKAGEELMGLVRVQEDAARVAQSAALVRQTFWNGPEAFETVVAAQSPMQADAMRSLANEGIGVREVLRASARRSEYVARRSVEWTQAQMDLMVQLLTRSEATYQQPGRERPLRETPSMMDRTV
jgi:hypothetical protein